LKTPQQVEDYFQNLAAKFDAKPSLKGKVLFTLAAFLFERDKSRALAEMQSAFDPKLVYAPADIDLYGGALIEQGKFDEAVGIFQKLAKDYPVPAGVAPDKAPTQIQEAQSISIYGIGRALQKQGNVAEAAQQFDTLKKLYPWSPKILEANFGIAQSLVQKGNLDDATALLTGIIRAPTATAELRADAMLLGGDIQAAKFSNAQNDKEKNAALDAAIDYYIKIATFYQGVPAAAAEGLWKGAQLLEQQAATLSEWTKPTREQQISKATKAYKDLTQKYPMSEFAEKAKERLQALSQTAASGKG